jgi:2-desacetyl-2-hydroxyethyl bacteriochlorophyllide A dehydrogenase
MAAGICGSDLHNYRKGMFMTFAPIITGHEFAGIVQDIGPAVKGLKPGDHVVADSRVYCKECEFCREERYNLCPNLGYLGEVMAGAFAQFALLEESQLFKLPPDLPLDEAALLEPFAVALHILHNLDIKKGAVLGIVGAGPIGLLAMLAAKELLQCPVIIIEPSKLRRDKAAQLGASKVLSPQDPKLNELFSAIPYVIEAAGNSNSFNLALKLIKRSGNIVLAGLFEEEYSGDINLITEKEITLKGVNGFTNPDMLEAIDLLHTKKIDLRGIIYKKMSLEQINEAFQLLNDPDSSAGKIIIEPHSDEPKTIEPKTSEDFREGTNRYCWINKRKDETNATFLSIGINQAFEWLDNHETIIAILERHCGCRIISGCSVINDEYVITSGTIHLSKDGCEFKFMHDIFDGGDLCIPDEKAVPIIEKVADDLISELKRLAAEGKPSEAG